MFIFYFNILFCSIPFIFSVYDAKLVKCLYNYPVNNNFLHLNDVSAQCQKESVDSYSYEDALKRCAFDLNCVYVRVAEYDVYNETHGNSKLCFSANLSALYPINNGLVSIKVDMWECQRLNCDYFTIGFYKENNNNIFDRDTVTRTNSAQFCVGDPLGLYSEGYLMAERVRSK
ncbi:conserved hypothetical protein [Theileria orientalis strain Shintoku]|uniref:PAN-3 domain-containing protein n=1 Tax=Theileria orientalis strain Shintoku TaxID=869250 RepID=J4D682_THEOR|nr:conserved hypothetical protein [Theileria orientalis strain Shintoku]PVC53330.1 hypothetical protein MACL_00000154 [Theileria orientalis]BAM39405.1 conserved hypothetical protein [Theileria orientalis strain Shintoku]|eukprot:XP_009689706.1 conserved hypothetical protein [Theileria orientalis strain Shintoku]